MKPAQSRRCLRHPLAGKTATAGSAHVDVAKKRTNKSTATKDAKEREVFNYGFLIHQMKLAHRRQRGSRFGFSLVFFFFSSFFLAAPLSLILVTAWDQTADPPPQSSKHGMRIDDNDRAAVLSNLCGFVGRAFRTAARGEQDPTRW